MPLSILSIHRGVDIFLLTLSDLLFIFKSFFELYDTKDKIGEPTGTRYFDLMYLGNTSNIIKRLNKGL